MTKRRLTATLLTVSILFGLLPGAAFAQEIPGEGITAPEVADSARETGESGPEREPEELRDGESAGLEMGSQEGARDPETGITMETVPEEVPVPQFPEDKGETGSSEEETGMTEGGTGAPEGEDGMPGEENTPEGEAGTPGTGAEDPSTAVVPDEVPVPSFPSEVENGSQEETGTTGEETGTTEEMDDGLEMAMFDLRAERAVAQVLGADGSVEEYDTVQRAINYAEAGDRVRLVENVSLTEPLTMERSVTFDLNGCILSGRSSSALILVSTSVTVEDSQGGGWVMNMGQGCAVQLAATGITLRVTGGHFYSPEWAVKIIAGTLEMTGGTVEGAVGGIYAGSLNNPSAVRVSGGTVSGKTGIQVRSGELTVDGNALVTAPGGTAIDITPNGNGRGVEAAITGGTFSGEISASNVEHFISGGEFDRAPKAEYIVEGSQTRQDGDEWIIEPSGESVAAIGSRGFGSLEAAFAAAGDGDVITLLKESAEQGQGTVEKSVTLDLNGQTVSVSGDDAGILIVNGGELTVTDSSQERNGIIRGGQTLIEVEKGGSFALEAGTLQADAGTALHVSGGGLADLTGGSIVAGNVGVEIGGGEADQAVVHFNGTGVTGDAASVAAIPEGGSVWAARVEITAGDFVGAFRGYDPEDMAGFYAGIDISGGAFTADVDRFIKDPALGQPGGTGLRAVGKRTAESIGNVASVTEEAGISYYGDVEAALRAASAGALVTLLADAACGGETLELRKSLTIDGEGHRLTVDGQGICVFGSGVELTLRNIAVSGREGRALSTQGGGVKLTLEGATLETAGEGAQALMIGGDREGSVEVLIGNGSRLLAGEDGEGISLLRPAEVIIGDSEVSGRTAVAIRDRDVTVEIRDSNITVGAVQEESVAWVILLTTEEGETAADALVTISGDCQVRMEGENAALVNAEGFAREENAGAALAVSGGTFNREVLQEYCAEGYLPVDNGDSTYGVTNTLSVTADRTSISGGGPVTIRVSPAGVAGEMRVTCDNGIEVSEEERGVYTAQLPNADGTYTFTAAVGTLSAQCGVSVTRYTSGGGGGSTGGGGGTTGGTGGGSGQTEPAGPSQAETGLPEEDLGENEVPLAQPLPFLDVTEKDWFYDAVWFVFDRDLMKGTKATIFAPEETTTRGMIVTILHRMEGEPEAAASTFTDVAGTAWYAKGVDWAAANGVVEGYGDGSFRPEQAITREELAAILSRYATFKGYDKSARGSVEEFQDQDRISKWAREELSWAVGAKLLSGKGDNRLDPRGETSRAEAAQMLKNFCESFESDEK